MSQIGYPFELGPRGHAAPLAGSGQDGTGPSGLPAAGPANPAILGMQPIAATMVPLTALPLPSTPLYPTVPLLGGVSLPPAQPMFGQPPLQPGCCPCPQ